MMNCRRHDPAGFFAEESWAGRNRFESDPRDFAAMLRRARRGTRTQSVERGTLADSWELATALLAMLPTNLPVAFSSIDIQGMTSHLAGAILLGAGMAAGFEFNSILTAARADH
jgi:hypothetical protein